MRKSLNPNRGDPRAILQELKSFGAEDPDYRRSRLWSLVYYLDESLERFLAQAYQTYASANGLNLLAVKTYRDRLHALSCVDAPEMILPTSAHVAWAKGAEYFGVRIV